MSEVFRLPRFRSFNGAMNASVRAGSHARRPKLTVDGPPCGPVSFYVHEGTVEFRVAAEDDGVAYEISGWFALDGSTAGGQIRDVIPEDMEDDDPDAQDRMMAKASREILPGVATIWLTVPEAKRFEMARDDAAEWARHIAAEFWLKTNTGRRKAAALRKEWEADVIAAQCRATAYALDGPVGVTARRLVEHGWSGDAEELLRTAEAVAAA
jgi:hypothetical protein